MLYLLYVFFVYVIAYCGVGGSVGRSGGGELSLPQQGILLNIYIKKYCVYYI